MSECNESVGSIPDLPSESSHGSSVSSSFINEYDELLKYAIVAPRFTLEQNVYAEKDKGGGQQEAELMTEKPPEKEVSFKVNPNYKTERNYQEVIESFGERRNSCEEQENAVEVLLECARTPAKESADNCEGDLSVHSTPENGACSPSPVDKDLVRMDGLMDEWSQQLKRNILDEVVNIKSKQIEEQELAITDLKAKHNMEAKKLNHEVDSLKELIYSFEQNVKQKDEMIQNLTDSLNKQKEKNDKIRLFSMWRLKLNDERREEFAAKLADKFHKKALCHKVWDGWRGLIENRWKVRVEKACQIKSQEVCIKLTEDYEERLQGLQKELETARTDVAKLHTERDNYEENMKKAFMRGVCALNMEAMSMFREGGNEEKGNGPTGTNPHYSCTEVGSQSSETAPRPETAFNCIDESIPLEYSKKHVTFNTQPFFDSSNVPKKAAKLPTKKNLHVKVTGKKENNSSAKKDKSFSRTGRPSSISSIKVERHIPPATIPPAAIPTRPASQNGHHPKINGKSDDSDDSSSKKSLPRNIKVVD